MRKTGHEVKLAIVVHGAAVHDVSDKNAGSADLNRYYVVLR